MTEPSRITEPPAQLAERLKRYTSPDGMAIDVPLDETPDEKREREALAQSHRTARWSARRPLIYTAADVSDLADETLAGWLESGHLTLVLAGPVGVGKTHAAYAIGNQAVSVLGLWCEAWTVTDLLDALRPGGIGASGIRDCDLLVLDDLGAQKPSDWAVETITALVDARTREGRRQIITTNAPYNALVEAWGGRLLDRLTFKWTPVTMAGPSRRSAAW